MSNKSIITAIKAGKNIKKQRSNIYLDGKFAFSLDNEVIVKESLRTGQSLSQAEIDILNGADIFQKCLNAAFTFLSYRPRSEAETRERLGRKGYETQVIDKVIENLKRLSLINDEAFAEFWKENRSSFSPRSQRAIKSELRRKGVEPEVIQEVAESMDDQESAYNAAIKKARTLKLSDYQIFRHKLGGYLQRRGFNYGVINTVVKQVWQELKGDITQNPDAPEDPDTID
jgi:regulatory protein